jgi:hypothetical protein
MTPSTTLKVTASNLRGATVVKESTIILESTLWIAWMGNECTFRSLPQKRRRGRRTERLSGIRNESRRRVSSPVEENSRAADVDLEYQLADA